MKKQKEVYYRSSRWNYLLLLAVYIWIGLSKDVFVKWWFVGALCLVIIIYNETRLGKEED